MAAGETLAKGGSWDEALVDGLVSGAATYLTAGMGDWVSGADTWVQIAAEAGAQGVATFGQDVAQQYVDGKDWDEIDWGGAATKGVISGVAAGVGSAARKLVGEGTWYQDIAGSMAQNAAGSAGNYASWELVDRGRMIDDLVEQYKKSGMSEEEAKQKANEQADKQERSMISSSIQSLATSGISAGLGLNGGSMFDKLGKAAVHLSSTVIGNEIIEKYGEKWGFSEEERRNGVLSTSVTLIGSVGNYEYLNTGLSFTIAGKGAGTFREGKGDIDAYEIVRAGIRDYEAYRARREAMEVSQGVLEAPQNLPVADLRETIKRKGFSFLF
jgi:hypothetical protein